MCDEILKTDTNGQWSLEKAKVLDMKSRKVVSNTPSISTPSAAHKEGAKIVRNAKEPKVHQPSVGSYNTHEMHVHEEGAAKRKKFQGGDPRHEMHGDKTKHGIEREIAGYDNKGKAHSYTSGDAGRIDRESRAKVPVRSYKLTKSLDSEIFNLYSDGQWSLEKAVPGIRSNPIFSMDHIKQVTTASDHDRAKNLAHDAIKSSNAHEHNKHSARLMVDQSKSIKHLASGMTNFHMAHDAKIRRRLNSIKDHE